jgi:hypothetical protein
MRLILLAIFCAGCLEPEPLPEVQFPSPTPISHYRVIQSSQQ